VVNNASKRRILPRIPKFFATSYGNRQCNQEKLGSSAMTAESLIRQRILQFIQDYSEWNETAQPPDRSPAQMARFAAARGDDIKNALDQVAAKHCVSEELLTARGYSYGTPSQHDPLNEAITSVVIKSETEATVETENTCGGRPHTFFEYKLSKLEEEWRIGKIRQFFGEENEAVGDEALLGQVRRKHAEPHFVEALPEGLERLFQGKARLNTRRDVANIEVLKAGPLSVPSGCIAGDDPGYWLWGASVFEMKVPPGEYELEVVTDGRIIGAARVVFNKSPRGSVRYALATRRSVEASDRGRSSHVMGVDSGRIGLADAAVLLTKSKRERERLDEYLCEMSAAQEGNGVVFAPEGEEHSVVAINSGCGDGAYPAFWVLDVDGDPAALILDFMDLGQSVHREASAALTAEDRAVKFDADAFEAMGIKVVFRISSDPATEGQCLLEVTAPSHCEVQIFDEHQKLVFDGDRAAHGSCGDWRSYQLPSAMLGSFVGTLRTSLYVGHRYDFVEEAGADVLSRRSL
jgi:hypothetical protein